MALAHAWPEFPPMVCSVCGNAYDLPRAWADVPVLGKQIIISWDAADELMARHVAEHNNELIFGLENMLREDAQRKGV